MVLSWAKGVYLLIIITQAAAACLDVGFNAVKLHHGDSYFTNHSRGLYSKIPVNATISQPISHLSFITNYGIAVDEFRFGFAGFQSISEDAKRLRLVLRQCDNKKTPPRYD